MSQPKFCIDMIHCAYICGSSVVSNKTILSHARPTPVRFQILASWLQSILYYFLLFSNCSGATGSKWCPLV
uniref:Uncharacterized protein n=1 Tax=Aegilops tauschii subsp. strangulata TaxID=200361 RepID=A0A453HFR3_AEGTS